MSTIDAWFTRPFLPKERYERARVLPVEFILEGEGLHQQSTDCFFVVPFIFSPYAAHRYSIPERAKKRKNEQLSMAYVYEDELFRCDLLSQDGRIVSHIQYGTFLFERKNLTPTLRALFRQADETFKGAQQFPAVVECVQRYQQKGVPDTLPRRMFELCYE